MVYKLIFLFIIALGFGFFLFKRISKPSPLLAVAFPSSKAALAYEPTNIHLDYEYIFLENLYSPLVEFDANGVIQPGVASRAEFIGDDVHFTIRPGLKTQSGVPITAEDVAFSLKRVLILSGNTHGNFRDVICPGVDLKSVDSTCPGLRIEAEKIILSAGKRKSFLLPMLAAIDFAIIPRSSVDPKSLKIINMRETSGPYFVDSDQGDGRINLKLNPSHYHAEDSVPKEIALVPMVSSTKGESIKALLEGKVDHLTTVDISRADETMKFAKNHPDFSLHTTHKIRTIVLTFTGRGLQRFSDPERRLIGAKVREAFKDIYADVPGMEGRDEFFPGLGDGSLTTTQRAELTEISKNVSPKITDKIRIGLLKRSDLESWSAPLSRVLPNAEFYRETDAPDLRKNSIAGDEPDAFIAATDTGFMEDISLISYSLNAGLLGLSKGERQKWLADYMATEQKADRMNLLRKLHFDALSKPVIVPLVASPYTALVRKPWKMELSELYANDQLWRIKHQ